MGHLKSLAHGILPLRWNPTSRKMPALLKTFLVIVIIVSTNVFARIEDFIIISADDTDFKPSKDEMKKILASADLDSMGYKREEITTTSNDSKGNSVNSTIIQYFKKVPCSDAPKTFKELKDRISDTRISALLDRTALDLSKQDTAGKMCQVGIKVDSKTSKAGSKMANYFREKRSFLRRRRQTIIIHHVHGDVIIGGSNKTRSG